MGCCRRVQVLSQKLDLRGEQHQELEQRTRLRGLRKTRRTKVLESICVRLTMSPNKLHFISKTGGSFIARAALPPHRPLTNLPCSPGHYVGGALYDSKAEQSYCEARH